MATGGSTEFQGPGGEGTKLTSHSMPEYTLQPDSLLECIVPSFVPAVPWGTPQTLLPQPWPSPADKQSSISLELSMKMGCCLDPAKAMQCEPLVARWLGARQTLCRVLPLPPPPPGCPSALPRGR